MPVLFVLVLPLAVALRDIIALSQPQRRAGLPALEVEAQKMLDGKRRFFLF